MITFGKYAKYYDLIYADKDYEAEVDFIEEIFRQFSLRPVKTVLDAGCGTGGHAFPLARRKHKVTGIDNSEPMLKRARDKAKNENLNLSFNIADLRQFNLKKKFDTVLCMFAVMGYITQNDDILATLKNIRRHLAKDSLFIFDFWNGLAVLRILPSVRVKTIESEGKRVIRTVHPELDSFNHLCKNRYHFIVSDKRKIIDEVEETHVVRYFFPQEIAYYLDAADFELVKICPFLDLHGKVDENVWSITAIAKAKGEK